MKQFKKLKKVWALMLALVMMLSVVPAETAWAADKYEVKRACAKNKVTVKDVMISYEEDGEDGYLMPGQSVEVYARGAGWDDSGKAGTIRYSSSDKSVVKIVGNGYNGGKVIKGLKEGTATITVKSKLGTAKCTVKVLPAMKLRVKNCRDVKKNGAIIGYSCSITNNGKKTVVFENGVKYEEEGGAPYYEPIQGKKVSIKPGQTKTVTVFTGDGRGLSCGAGYRMKYLGHYVCADIGSGNTKLDYFRVVAK